MQGTALGASFDGTLWIGSSRSFTQIGANGESLLTGRVFGITPSIGPGQDGNLFVVSLSDDAIYIISPVGP